MIAAGDEQQHSLFVLLLMQAFTYGVVTWLIWIAITFLAARWGGRFGALGGWFVVTIILYVLDVRWIQAEMNKPGWDGTPDVDIVFDLGVVIRAALVNALLLPIVFLGFWMRRRGQRRKQLQHRQRLNPLGLTPSAPPPMPTHG